MNSPHNADAAQPSLRVLIVDDSPEDASLIVQELAHSQFQVSWERVENEADYLQQLQTVPGLILADCTLSHFSAARALQLLQPRQFSSTRKVVKWLQHLGFASNQFDPLCN